MTTANHYDFSNRAALVFGGTSGIGRATALRFARAGAMVAVAARGEEVGRRTCDELARDGAQSLFVKTRRPGRSLGRSRRGAHARRIRPARVRGELRGRRR